MSYFSKPYNCSKNKIEVELNLSSYARKSDLKMQQALMHQNLLKKTDLADVKSGIDELDIDKLKNVHSGLSSLKSNVDKLDIGKLEITPIDLSKLNDVVKKDWIW